MFSRSRRNLARWFTLSMASILIAFAGVLYYLEVVDELEALDLLLYKKNRLMARSVEYEFKQGHWQVDLEKVPLLGNKPLPLESELVYARWYDAEGQLVQFYGMPPPDRLAVSPGFQTIKAIKDQRGVKLIDPWLRQATLPVQEDGLVIGYFQVATSLAPLQDNLAQLQLSLALAVPVALGVIGITGWLLGGLAMQPIRQTYEQLQRFTANASHELRAPLAAVLSNAQVGLLDLEEEGDISQQRRYLEKIVKGTKSMSALISNLLFLARHEGPLPLESLKMISLNSLLQELADHYKVQAIAQNLALISHLPEQPVIVQAAPDLLRQAVINLLTNACKYTPAGRTIQLRLFTQFNQAVIQVEDSGVGISKADLPHVFERFYRVDTGRTRETGGSGLGLAIAQQIVQSHAGQISVTSLLGKGSTFQITLPIKSKF